ncbi:hypothetical protein RHGRI_019965 [Rhododendron griersonianum]|uniref:Glycoside hydrolase family 5 domain-containing protein n=1 Tax=Rhododendron griersonianum TaxID=479676 RepID=A0AAV6JGS5_9ERIC|nr:hypothetical protein RHGRI_019965 [Rhododendron griersonianum]
MKAHVQNLSLTCLIIILTATTVHSLTLSTSSRWIVSPATGHRYKLRCVNWVGHLHTMVPEGLHKQPLTAIASHISSTGFNCVRLTWPTYMFTRPNYSSLTVAQSLDQWSLGDAKAGMARNNPSLLDVGVWDAQKAVIDGLGALDIMVVLDNHVSLPKWCCGGDDGNGFFGDEFFEPGEWLLGLTAVATRYLGNPTVVGMSMRNELRGPHQNPSDWYKYMQQGAEAIHRANPNVLVIVSGVSFDTNLGFLKNRSLEANVSNKLVYEAHWYSFGNPTEKWLNQTNGYCGNVTQSFLGQSGFLGSGPSPVPLFLSEFGVDQTGGNEAQNRYLGCLLGLVAERDLDWAWWALQGSYMLREGKVDAGEDYGVLDFNWESVRNSSILKKLQLIQQITQDPKSNNPSYQIMYHPQSGQCVQSNQHLVYLSDCQNWSRWSYDKNGGPIKLMDSTTPSCLSAAGDGLPVVFSDDCSGQQSVWALVSGSKFHIAAKDKQGSLLCLDWDSSSSGISIVTKKCLCLGNDGRDVPTCVENPQRQWFNFVPSNK